MSLSTLQRIQRVQKYYYDRGKNSERVNSVLRNVLKLKYEKANR